MLLQQQNGVFFRRKGLVFAEGIRIELQLCSQRQPEHIVELHGQIVERELIGEACLPLLQHGGAVLQPGHL